MSTRVAIALLLLLALVLRAWDFPQRHEVRDADELAYVAGSLQLLEGLDPPHKHAPAGPQTWVGWFYAGGQTARYLVDPTAEEHAVAPRVRPVVATNHALWDNYADLGKMRAAWIFVALLAALWAIIEAFKLGVYAIGPSTSAIVATDADDAATLPKPFEEPPIDTGLSPPPPPPPHPTPRQKYDSAAVPAGFLVAGIIAFTPLLVFLGGAGRPHVTAWCFGIIAASLAIRRPGPRGQILSAILMGLAIASRLDMLLLLPIVWSEQFARRREYGFVRSFVGYHVIAAIVTLLVAPWLMTDLIGNVQAIAAGAARVVEPIVSGGMPRGAGAGVAVSARGLRDLALSQGLWLLPLLALVGILWPRRGQRVPRLLLAIYVIALVGAAMFKARGFAMQHYGAPIVVMIVMSAFALRPLAGRGGKIAWIVVGLALIVPIVQTARSVAARQSAYADDAPAIAWIEQNIPPGTRVYSRNSIYNPLPTRAAADALWAEVNDGGAWEKKVLADLAPLNLSADRLPRALSDQHMLRERGGRRGWFILGSRGDVGRPRYDVRLIAERASLFGVHDVRKEFSEHGGVILWRGTLENAQVAGLTPAARFEARNKKNGVFVFVSADVKLSAAPLATTAPVAVPPPTSAPTTAATAPATHPTTKSAP
ncbi:MAG: hypothetical protein QOF78_747 [Phycisphaerales bacterium]|jgi:hypothetical protein|nr:hypothetical protein [Phycisphaerales bacterium]